MSENRPLCFVLMPFGIKFDSDGHAMDFDAVYEKLIAPSIRNAGLSPIRADEERTGGIIHKATFERLALCEYAVADLTIANANVYYELGIRHAVRPRSTILAFAKGIRLPFDLAPMRGVPYQVDEAGILSNAEEDRDLLTKALIEARPVDNDSPFYQLVDGMAPPDISRLKTDLFRERIEYSATLKEGLMEARKQGVEAIEAVKAELGPIGDVEPSVMIDLLLSFRAVRGWTQMVTLVKDMAPLVARTVLVREQHAFALNRQGEGEKAERILLDLMKDRGSSSETYGILARVYKDRWEIARDAGQTALARGLLDKAIDAYLKGFRSDVRDAYLGINALTLMELRDPPDPRATRILPVVMFIVRERLESGQYDYWDNATLLELAILGNDREQAESALAATLASIREVWEPETTLRNLRLIREARQARGEVPNWMLKIEEELEKVT